MRKRINGIPFSCFLSLSFKKKKKKNIFNTPT